MFARSLWILAVGLGGLLAHPAAAPAAPGGKGKPSPNQAPIVQAGPNQVLTALDTQLAGSVGDDGPLADLVTQWTQLSGPGPVDFADPAAPDTTASFPGWGTYVLRLTADDGVEVSSDEVAISVVAGPLDLRAFPEAEGFGARAVGGRGGRVIEVTTLADSGPGSFRAAVEASGPRTVVFRVGGIIWLETGLEVHDPYLSVAGHTAPGSAGITLANGSSTDSVLKIETHDVVIRHLRIRPGPGGDADGISIERGVARNVIVDHCSIGWGVDENISTYRDAHHVTLQWSIVSEGLDCSTHSEGCHSKGMLIGSEGGHSTSIHHNLFAHNVERSPRVSADGVVDIVNNVVYNPGFDGGWGPSHVSGSVPVRVNYVGNVYEPGVDSGSAAWFVSAGGANEIYLEGNQVPDQVIRPSELGQVVGSRHPAEPVTTTSAQLAFTEVLASAGASLALACDGSSYPRRDPVDERIVGDVIQGTGSHIDDPSEVGGHPPATPGTPCADADGDGLPDLWETGLGLDPADASDAAADPDGDGYTALEDYLNGAVSAPVVTITSPADGSLFGPGEPIGFQASAHDAQDGDLGAALAWRSDADGPIGSGGSIETTLSAGPHTVTAEVSDSTGLGGSDSIAVQVADPSAPSVTIETPADGAGFLPGEAIAFLATALDAQGGDVGASLVWTSSLGGAIGAGASFSAALGAGSHEITATATDGAGASGQDRISVVVNTPPSAVIEAPAEGATFASADAVLFSGSADDAEEGILDESLVWSSSLDGPIGGGASFTASLTPGTHLIEATVSDSSGASASDRVTIEVTAPSNAAPSVTISLPADGSTVPSGRLVAFAASASDPEDGDVSASVVWSSDLDGPVGSGPELGARLTAIGFHTLTATARDAGGLEGSAQVVVRVNPALRLAPFDDASVDSKQPTRNLGSAQSLELRGHPRQVLESYLKFEVPAAAGAVRSAVLRLHLLRGKAEDASVHRVSNDYQDGAAPWTEAALTWQNRPGLSAAGLLGSGGPGLEEGWLEIDVSGEIAGAGTYSFGLGTDAKSLVSCESKEAPGPAPELLLELEP